MTASSCPLSTEQLPLTSEGSSSAGHFLEKGDMTEGAQKKINPTSDTTVWPCSGQSVACRA